MDVSFAIMLVMAVFMVIGAVDKGLLGGRLGYADKFTEGLDAMGPLAAAMLGLMCFAPVLGKVLAPAAVWFYGLFQADPSMLAGTLLPMDMGGYPLAQELALTPEAALFAGCLYSSTLGCTICFSIPVALGIIKGEDKPFFTQGMLAGLLSIAPACLIGALLFGLPTKMVLHNSLPALLFTLVLALCLWKFPKMTGHAFLLFSKFITAVIYLTLAAAVFEALTGIVVIPGMAEIGPQLKTVGIIGITLAGTYPLMHFLTKTLQKPLSRAGARLGVNDIAMGGMLACLANNIPTLGMVKDINPRGKVVAIAFSVPASFVVGDYLAYVSANFPQHLPLLVVTKLLGGIIAILCALLLTKKGHDESKTPQLSVEEATQE